MSARSIVVATARPSLVYPRSVGQRPLGLPRYGRDRLVCAQRFDTIEEAIVQENG